MIIGIDLGTTNSLVACFRDGKPEIITNRLGKDLTPSVVSVDEEGVVLVGETAKEYGMLHPLNTAKVFKRNMGTEKEYKLGSRKFTPEELSSFVLRSLKEDAENYLGCEIEEAIISVPAYFNDYQRKATKRAGELAGLKVERIINEPTAAAMAYGVGSEDKNERCLVFDLGGGTFDVSILEFFDNIMEVHAIAGDNFIGGEDFTRVLADMFLEKSLYVPEKLDVRTMNKVMAAAEKCKCSFTEAREVTMSCVIEGNMVEKTITLHEYEDACADLLSKLRKPIERSLKDADVSLEDIDRIVLAGGATRLPIVRSFIAKLFRRIPDALVNPDTAIVAGVAIQCGMKERNHEIKEVVLTDVCPFTLGTEIIMSNGIFDEPGHYLPIIDRNTVIPVSRTQTVYTAHDNQSRIKVEILQGESRKACNNIKLGELSIPVPPGPAGKEGITITYTYDINSLLEAEICSLTTGEKRKTVVQGDSCTLTEEEITERFKQLQYLKQNPRDDEENRLIMLRAERVYEEAYSEERSIIDMAIMEFESVLAGQDRTKIEKARKKLSKTLDKFDYYASDDEEE